jgi:hypothetical protein
LNFPLSKEIVEWTGDELKKMENLKTLVVKTSFYPKPDLQDIPSDFRPKNFPNSLRVLEWPNLQDIPSDFRPKNFSICKLPNSGLTSLNRMVMISPPSFWVFWPTL